MLYVGSVRKGTERIEWGSDETKYKHSHRGFSTLKSAGGIDGGNWVIACFFFAIQRENTLNKIYKL